MVLSEQYLKGILRPPPTSLAQLPPNPPHPFQTSFTYYLRTRVFKHHTPLLIGYAFSIWVFGQLDGAMEAGKKASYEKTIMEGKTPGGHH